MKCKVELYVAGKTFNESVYARDYDEAEASCTCKKSKRYCCSVTADFYTDDNY